MHGEGTFILSNGMKYVGGWKNGRVNEQGTMICPDGAKYVGKWKFRYMRPDELKTLRKQNGYSQEQLSKASGISLQSIRRWERGDAKIPELM